MTQRLPATFLVLVLALSAPSGATAQPELQRLMREREVPVVPRLPRLPYGPRPPLDVPFPMPVPRPNASLSPHDVMAILAARNLALIGELRRRGNYYVLDARGSHGEVVRLVVNAFSGVVEGVRVLSPRTVRGDAKDGGGPKEGGAKEGGARDDPRPEPPPR